METGNLESCGALMYCRSTGRHLFLLRNHKRHKNSWGFVGGRIEARELPIDALRREIQEEIGMDVSGLRARPIEQFTSDDGAFVYHTFMIIVEEEFIPNLNNEHDGYCWVPLEKYPRPLHPGVWQTFKFEEVIKKIRTLESL
jgi:8-oxo-dGTP pyrophosphatase MutT (NUDIX family)